MIDGASLVDILKRLETEALAAVERASEPSALEAVRVEYLGRREGKVSALLQRLATLPAETRPRVGAEANRVKRSLADALDRRSTELLSGSGDTQPPVDLTLPGRRPWRGARHPVTLVVDEICGIFRDLGFTRVRGPELETEWYNFVALNTPLDHPAADEQDTLYLKANDLLLRSHTSPVQVRTLEPVRATRPGRGSGVGISP